MLRAVLLVGLVVLIGIGGAAAFGIRLYIPGSSSGPMNNSAGLIREISTPPVVVKNETPPSGDMGRVIPAVVRVTGPNFAGSGVIIDPAGMVLTSAHVVGDAARVSVVVEDSRRLTGRVVRVDSKRDLALVQLPEGVYQAASLDGGLVPMLGSVVIAVGYPLGLPGPASVTTQG